jgi:alpha-glucosidase
VEAQTADPASTLELYRRAIRIRRDEPGLGEGTMRWRPSPPDTLVFLRDPDVLVAVNLGTAPLRVEGAGEPLLTSQPLADPLTLPPDTAGWYRSRNAG